MKNIQLAFLIMLVASFFLHAQERQKDTSLKPVYANGRWGYADSSGKIAIAARFDAALPFAAGLARVGVVDEELPEIDRRPNLLWGYINERGVAVVELRYNALHPFSDGLAAAAVLDNESKKSAYARRLFGDFRWGYVDREGHVVIPIQYFGAGDFSEGLANVNVGRETDSNCGRPGNYGYIDKSGAFVIKPQFAMASAFKDGRAHVSVGYTEYVGRCMCCGPRFIGKFGYVNRNGEFIVEGKSDGDEPLSDSNGSEYRQ